MYWSTLDSVWFRRGQVCTLWTTEKIRLVIFRVPHSTPPGPPGPAFHWRHDANRIRSGRMWSQKKTSSGWNTCVALQKRKMFGVKLLQCKLEMVLVTGCNWYFVDCLWSFGIMGWPGEAGEAGETETASRWKRMERNHADFFASSSELSKHLGSCRTCFQAALPLICDLISKRKNVTIQKVSKSQPDDCAELVCRNFTIKLRKLLLP